MSEWVNRVINFNFLAPAVSEIIKSLKFTLKGPAPPHRPLAENFDTPQVRAYTYITVKFQRRSSINVQLTDGRALYNRFRIERFPKMGFWSDFGGRCKDIWWEIHSSSELRVLRHLWSRSDAPCSSILYGYSHLP